MKFLKRFLSVLVVFSILLALAVTIFLRHSLAPMDGQLKLDGLSQKTTLTRDNFGIPHIKAANRLDALRSLGFFMASERLFQMDIQRRLTQGKLSEIFGEVALPTDKLYRSLMIKRSVERMIEVQRKNGSFDETTWNELTAYFAGVNEYIKTQALPYEFTILRITPEPFSPIDAYIMTGHMAYSFGIALKADPLMTELAKKLTPDLFQELRNDLSTGPYKIAGLDFKASQAIDYFNAPLFEGSNAWLLSPARSSSGKSLFANDPHIGFSNPSVWVEAHIQTPGFELYGHYLPLVPFAILGHSRHHAWGFTMLLVDDMDLYRETLDLDKKTVIYKNKAQSYIEWNEVIKVKGQPDVTLTMIETPHGPLLNHTLEGQNVSLKWAFHDPANDTLRALRLMGEAKTMTDFENALKPVTAPRLNVMYADSENIAWWTLGDIALKKNSNSDLILNGSSGDDEYLNKLAWKDKPHAVNPPSGIIITANSRPSSLPASVRGDWQPDDRFHTLETLLAEKPVWSPEEVQELQTQYFNIFNEKIRSHLVDHLSLTPEQKNQYAPIIEAFKKWDLHSNVDSQEAALYHLWNAANVRLLLQDFTAEERETYLATAAPWTFYKRVLSNENSPWWKKRSYNSIVTAGFLEVMMAYPRLPMWGDIHTIEYQHPLGRLKPLNKIFNVGPYPIGGAYNDIPNNKYWAFGGKDFKVTAGASTRRIIDMAHPEKSWGINPIGISGHILSPYSRTEVQLFIEGKYRDQLMDDKDIKAVQTHELTLTP